ncbi:uncharacterized protein LOC119275812 isoform X1 [Triticum dicoccoides]|nr:uncharacterized protein LOC119275812 isoform X1 [Triticum dicoccoides]XP_044331477.1 uncharacterized protein LOC123052393 isoform X1 [Triticum aestivum]
MVVQCFFEVYIGTMLKRDMIGSEDCQSSRHIPVCYQTLKKEKQLYSVFLENLPVEYLDTDKYAIKDIFDGFSLKTWRIFFVDSLVLSWLFCSDFPSVHYLVTIYCSSTIVQLLTLWCFFCNFLAGSSHFLANFLVCTVESLEVVFYYL